MRVVMLELLAPATRQSRAITKAEVRTIIKNGHVGFTEQPGDGAEGAAEAAIEEHGIFAAEKIRDAPFQFAMQISHAGEDRCAASAEPMGTERLLSGGNHLGVIGEAKIIIGTKVDDRVRLALVFQGGTSVRTGEHLRLI